MDDAREVSGYARLSKVYKKLGVNEETALPIKCLIIYPDQDQEERFTFTRTEEPAFEKVLLLSGKNKLKALFPFTHRCCSRFTYPGAWFSVLNCKHYKMCLF